MSSRIVQQTLEGLAVSAMPRVRTTDGHLLDWNRDAIAKQLLKETKLSEQFYKEPGITPEEAQDIAREVERRVRWMNVQYLSGPLVREIMNVVLLERHHTEWRNICTRVGTPVFDAHLIDIGTGFESKENANLQENAETSHKKKADKISKEQYLLLLPPHLADRHLAGDLHIHDLEYFGTRPFCIDGCTAVPVIDKGIRAIIRPDEMPFDGDYYYPEELYAISPRGPKKVIKVSRRPADRDLLKIKTTSGKSLKVTHEHRIPVIGQGIKKAEDINPGDVLSGAFENGLNLRAEPIESLDLINEFVDKVPASDLESIFVRGARPLFHKVIEEGRCQSFSDISLSLGVEHHKEWYTRGIMPISLFKRFADYFGLDSCAELRIGATGSEHDLPSVFTLTADVAKMLGYFISEGNYNIQQGHNYNLVITGSKHAETVKCCANGALNTYATTTEGNPSTRTIYGIEGEWERAKQVYFGGKLIFLLFRYVFGIAGKSYKKRIPSIVYQMSDGLLHHFLSALFTGDGSAFYRPEKSDCIVNYTTASEMLRQELCLLLTSLGMNPQVVELYEGEERRTLYRIQLNGFRNILAFSKVAGFLDSRQEHIDRFLSEVKETHMIPKQEVVREIVSAKPSGEYVYDLFLEGDDEESHTYFASDGLLIHNCQDWDLRYFLYYGLMPDGLGTKASVAGPAKKPEVAMLHAVKALGSAQTNFAGGQGFYNFLTFIAPYFEGKDYGEIVQLMQMFVYEMTQMMVARGGQLVFSSVQLTPGVPKLWKDKPAVFAGKVWNGSSPEAPLKTYGQFEREVRLAFKALMEVMLAGDYWGKPFNFPKPEISIEPDFMKEDEAFNAAHPDLPTYQQLYLMTFKLAAEYGTPYFDNQLPAYRGAGEGISCYQCCAYQFAATYDSDSLFEDKLYFKEGKHFSMGSWQVVSLNCPRAAYLARGDDELLFEYLRELMDTSVEIFKVKRQWMNQVIKNHRMPFATQQPRDPRTGEKGSVAVDLEGLVYTIGVVGVNEMVQFHTGKQMHESKEAWKLAVRAMTEMEIYAKKLSMQHGMTIALARTPAETTAQRFAVSDLIHEEYRDYAEKVVKGDLSAVNKNLHKTRDLPVYYTNGTHLPPSADVTIFERAKLEHVFFPIVDGGNIFHIFMGEATPDPQGLMDFGMRLSRETQIGYFTFSRDMTVCLGCSQVSGGLKEQCPNCGSSDVDHISRITGYLQAVSGWNNAKRQELKDRKRYNELA
ncbi:MAG: anaerobic ribonucleoside triphosphate reductase [Methanosaeta sp. PtaU1.Bin112]|nr:MAG: anaerobic ribonucleoside triphosphate reductase [Methanosaeta sp. PtaU1.Bin112]